METIEEKAQAYTDSTDTRVFGCEETLDATELIQRGYIVGANDALAGQWRNVDDTLPETDEDVLVVYSRSYTPTYIEMAVAYYDGEDWYTQDGSHIRPTYWMAIPEPPKSK
ncbi:MAG: DUF551 domain-containing protein [Bacteroides sp.]|nr:DUF551 domain-containing protein [Bacteroides sp.]